MIWFRNSRLSRCPASSSAAVVRCMSCDPASRMKRFRRSCRCIRMKITKMTTMPVVVSGWISGWMMATRVVSVPGSGCLISTGIGLSCGCRRRPSIDLPPGGIVQLAVEFPQHFRCAFQRARAAGRDAAQVLNLVTQRLLVAGQFLGQPVGLRDHQAAEAEDDREADEHRDQHRQPARHPPGLQPDDERREHETEEHRKRHRNQDFAGEVQAGDDQPGDREIDQRGAFGRCSSIGGTVSANRRNPRRSMQTSVKSGRGRGKSSPNGREAANVPRRRVVPRPCPGRGAASHAARRPGP